MKLLTLFFVTCLSLLQGVTPLSRLSDLDREMGPGTWLVLDVDRTLIYPKEHILSWEMLSEFIRLCLEVDPTLLGRDRNHLRSILMRDMEWELVSEDTHHLIARFQSSGATVIALTAMDPGPFGVLTSIAKWRVDQLRALSIDFRHSSPSVYDDHYRDGVLFSKKIPKGKVLLAFLEKIGEKPQRILFIDDRIDFCISVEESAKAAGIPCEAFHLLSCNQKKLHFDPEKVKKQIRHLVEHEVWHPHL